jgi:Trypsin-co-occurring domain 1
MTQLAPIELEDGTIIYMEVQEEVEIAPRESTQTETEGELTRDDLGRGGKGIGGSNSQNQIVQNFQAIEGTIRAYTNYTLNAFKNIANANINKVTLEFGIKVGGKAGIPYVTEDCAESHLKITVECSFPEQSRPIEQ